jgi:hypothetical protein
MTPPRSPAARTRAALAALAVFTALVLSGCGYSLAGRGNSLPATIKIIGVPQFANHSTIAGLDIAITDAVRAELLGRGRYTVQPEATGVDAVLTGTIEGVRLEVVAFTPTTHQASRLAIIGSVNVEFRDVKESKVLWANPAVPFREEYDITSGTTASDPAAFLSGDKSAADRLAKSIAKTIITSILEAF